MGTAAITALAGLIGILVGRFWDNRSELARTRRDLRTRSYEDVATEFYQHRSLIQKCSALAVDSVEKNEAIRALEDHHAVWNQRLISVWIHGSEAAASAAYALDHELSILGQSSVQEQIAVSDWPLRREPVQRKFDDYLDAVRRDLSLPALQVLRANAADRIS